MTAIQRVYAYADIALLVAALIGILVRRHYRTAYSFGIYLAAVLISDVLMAAWPGRFYTRSFWLGKEWVISLLSLTVALELSFRTFAAFPGARATGRRAVIAVVVLTLVAIFAAGLDFDYRMLVGKTQPRILNGTIWLFTAIAGLILWYRLPVAAFHKAILIGFVPYLLIFSIALNVLHTYGWEWHDYVIHLEPLGWLLVLLFWTYATWSPRRVPVRAPAPAREVPHSA